LTDAQTGNELAGLIHVSDENGKPVSLDGLMSRGVGLSNQLPISRWSVLPKSVTLRLPRQKLTITAISGLETETVIVTVDPTTKTKTNISIPLERFYNAANSLPWVLPEEAKVGVDIF
jgi:hypothetical protein